LRVAEGVAKKMWIEGRLDIADPNTFQEYFAVLYRSAAQDARQVMTAERGQDFKSAAERFRMIEESGESVVAPYGDWERRVSDVLWMGVSRERMRRLQPLMVNLYAQEVQELRNAGALERVADTFWAVVPAFPVYSERWGFGWSSRLASEPEDLIA
jgi:hypothetical protein